MSWHGFHLLIVTRERYNPTGTWIDFYSPRQIRYHEEATLDQVDATDFLRPGARSYEAPSHQSPTK